MPSRKAVIAGYNVEVWHTSFRVEGMHRVLHVGHHIDDGVIQDIISTIHQAVADKAEKEGREKAADALCKMITNAVMEE